jgi:uncharacterized membrane protein YeaQ/YmgE (transglycosylase-associated protein family)
MLHLIGYIVFGLVVGLIARAVTPGHQHMSLPITAALGIVGALLAGWIGRAVGWYGPDDNAGFITSTIGAVLLLFAYHQIGKRRAKAAAGRSDQQFPRKVA